LGGATAGCDLLGSGGVAPAPARLAESGAPEHPDDPVADRLRLPRQVVLPREHPSRSYPHDHRTTGGHGDTLQCLATADELSIVATFAIPHASLGLAQRDDAGTIRREQQPGRVTGGLAELPLVAAELMPHRHG